MSNKVEYIKPIKKIVIGNDPFSLKFKDELMNSFHYKTMWQLKNCPDIPMRETYYYQWFAKEIQNRGSAWNGIVKTEGDIRRQYTRFKSLYDSYGNWEKSDTIKKITSQTGKDEKVFYYGNFPCKIKDNGDIFLFDGHHRAAMLLFNNEHIELSVCECDNYFNSLSQCILKLYPNKNMYQPIPHPFFDDWKCGRETTKEELLADIVQRFGIRDILDLGVCHGYTLYKLRGLIETGLGVEYNDIRHKIASLIYNKIKFRCIQNSIQDFITNDNEVFDAIFALAVLHHTMKEMNKEDFVKMLKTIRRKCRLFVYSLPESTEVQYEWMYKDITDYKKFIKDSMGFKNEEVFKLRRREMVILY